MSKSILREKTIQTRVSDQEFNMISEKAERLGLSVSNYLRMIALHAKIDISVNPDSKND